jgi:hypothetical protein
MSWTRSGIEAREESDPLDLFRKLFVEDPKAAKHARKLELDRQGSVLELAELGRLGESAVPRKQVERLLDDPRSNRFSRSFAGQWLSLDKLGSMPPDTKVEFRVHDSNKLEPAKLEETRQYIHNVLHQNRSVRDYVDSNCSFVNRELADLYRVPFEGMAMNFVESPSHRVGLGVES